MLSSQNKAQVREESRKENERIKKQATENRRIQQAYNLAAMIYGKGKAKVLPPAKGAKASVGNFKKFAPCRFHRICIRARRELHRKHDGGLEIRDIPPTHR